MDLSHDLSFAFFFGDLNYRIDLECDEIKKFIAAKNWDVLTEWDQVSVLDHHVE